MNKSRLEAFSDGVIAIIITIMVLELKIVHGTSWEAIKPVLPVLSCYIISFIYVGIYWGNHHHLLHTVKVINGKIMWANLHLLFWLSLVPFSTAWMGENCFDKVTIAAYAGILLMCGVAYTILQHAISLSNHFKSDLSLALKGDSYKGIISMVGYLISIPLAFVFSWISAAIIIGIAIMWLVPSKAIEDALSKENEQ